MPNRTKDPTKTQPFKSSRVFRVRSWGAIGVGILQGAGGHRKVAKHSLNKHRPGGAAPGGPPDGASTAAEVAQPPGGPPGEPRWRRIVALAHQVAGLVASLIVIIKFLGLLVVLLWPSQVGVATPPERRVEEAPLPPWVFMISETTLEPAAAPTLSPPRDVASPPVATAPKPPKPSADPTPTPSADAPSEATAPTPAADTNPASPAQDTPRLESVRPGLPSTWTYPSKIIRRLR